MCVRVCVCACVPGRVKRFVLCVCLCRCEASVECFCKRYAYLSLSCLHQNRQGHCKGELGTVVTVHAVGFGVLTLKWVFLLLFFDKGMCRRREASAVQRTPSPSVASQADSLLTVHRLITGHGK